MHNQQHQMFHSGTPMIYRDGRLLFPRWKNYKLKYPGRIFLKQGAFILIQVILLRKLLVLLHGQ